MKIVFLGDSIRQQYAPRVKELLGENFDIWYPDDNCRFCKYTLRGLFEWSENIENADIIHWNNGLWDICNLWGFGTFTSEDEYISNMLQILDILQKKHKVIIFATTTPVRKENKYNKNTDIERFNEIIVPRLTEKGAIINDLYKTISSDIYKYISEDTIHLSDDGITLCANQVAECIKNAAKSIDNIKNSNKKHKNDKDISNQIGLPVLL